MSDTATFYRTLMIVDAQESNLKQSQALLKEAYPVLVESCPHVEAIEYSFKIRGHAAVRLCKTCGVEDHGLIDASPGDEYDYGYAGRHDKEFWAGTAIEVTEDLKEFSRYRKGHGYRVVNGKATA